MVKTVDRIVDPNQSDPIIRELFLIKDLFSKIPDDQASLKFIQEGLMKLKEDKKYSIDGKKELEKTNPEDALKI